MRRCGPETESDDAAVIIDNLKIKYKKLTSLHYQGLPSPLKDGDTPQLAGATRPRRRRRRGWEMGRGFPPPQPIKGAGGAS